MNKPLFPDLAVNGEHIPASAIAAEAQHHAAPKGKPGLAWRKAAKALAIRALLLQEARRRGIAEAPRSLGEGRTETGEEALIRGLLEDALSVAPPTEAEIRAEWARDPARFRAPPLWEVSHILCACDPGDATAREAARRRAVALAESALAAPTEFAQLAAQHSDCGSKASGGALGQLGPGDTLPEFEARLRGMAESEITPEPVLTRHGWHVIRMDAVAEGRVLPFEAVRKNLAQALEKTRWARSARDFVSALAARADISGVDLRSPLPE